MPLLPLLKMESCKHTRNSTYFTFFQNIIHLNQNEHMTFQYV